MKKSFSIKIEVDEDDLSALISTAMSDACGFAWWDRDDADYERAKSELISERKPDADDQICVEDIYARILMNGGKLNLLDSESDWHWSGHEPGEMLWNAQLIAEGCHPVGGEWHKVGLEDVVRGIELYAESRCASDCGPNLRKIVEDGDFWDADAVFQCAAYGEVVYG